MTYYCLCAIFYIITKIDGDIIYGWAKKITKIIKEKNSKDKLHPLNYHNIYGTDKVVFVDNQKYIQHNTQTPRYEGRREAHSNAQQFARELTITEKLLCRIFLKKQEAKEKSTHSNIHIERIINYLSK